MRFIYWKIIIFFKIAIFNTNSSDTFYNSNGGLIQCNFAELALGATGEQSLCSKNDISSEVSLNSLFSFSTIGIVCNDAVVFAIIPYFNTDGKCITINELDSHLYGSIFGSESVVSIDQFRVRKIKARIHIIDKNKVLSVTGISSDCDHLLDIIRTKSSSYFNKYSEFISISDLSDHISSYLHKHTLGSDTRPLAVSVLIAQVNHGNGNDGKHLIKIDSSGAYDYFDSCSSLHSIGHHHNLKSLLSDDVINDSNSKKNPNSIYKNINDILRNNDWKSQTWIKSLLKVSRLSGNGVDKNIDTNGDDYDDVVLKSLLKGYASINDVKKALGIIELVVIKLEGGVILK